MFKKLVIIAMLSHPMMGMNNNNEEKCPICLDPIKLFMKFSCNHAMHIECYNEYRTHQGDVCPTCPRTTVKNNNQSFLQKIVSRATGTQEDQKRLTSNIEMLERGLKMQRDLNEERRLEIIRLKEELQEQKQRDYRTLADLKNRYDQLKERNKNKYLIKIKKLIPNPFNYYGFVGMSAMLAAVLVQRVLGFVEFRSTSITGITKDFAMIATTGYCSSLFGVGTNKVLDKVCGTCKEDSDSYYFYLGWLVPVASGTTMGFLASNIFLEKINITALSNKYDAISWGILCATGLLSGGTIHYAHQKWYANPK